MASPTKTQERTNQIRPKYLTLIAKVNMVTPKQRFVIIKAPLKIVVSEIGLSFLFSELVPSFLCIFTSFSKISTFPSVF